MMAAPLNPCSFKAQHSKYEHPALVLCSA